MTKKQTETKFLMLGSKNALSDVYIKTKTSGKIQNENVLYVDPCCPLLIFKLP